MTSMSQQKIMMTMEAGSSLTKENSLTLVTIPGMKQDSQKLEVSTYLTPAAKPPANYTSRSMAVVVMDQVTPSRIFSDNSPPQTTSS